jgi:hypothetical protein
VLLAWSLIRKPVGSCDMPSLATNTGNLLNQPTTGLLFPHDLHSLPRHLEQPREVDLHLCPDLLRREFFENSGEAISSISNDDIHAAELIESLLEDVLNITIVRYVQLQRQIVLGGCVLE